MVVVLKLLRHSSIWLSSVLSCLDMCSVFNHYFYASFEWSHEKHIYNTLVMMSFYRELLMFSWRAEVTDTFYECSAFFIWILLERTDIIYLTEQWSFEMSDCCCFIFYKWLFLYFQTLFCVFFLCLTLYCPVAPGGLGVFRCPDVYRVFTVLSLLVQTHAVGFYGGIYFQQGKFSALIWGHK